MSVETVKTYLKSFGRDEDVQEFPVSSATVELAAAALSVEPARIAKTLSFADGDGCLLVVTAGDQKIDNAKFKAAFGMKAKMLPGRGRAAPDRSRGRRRVPLRPARGGSGDAGHVPAAFPPGLSGLRQRQFRHRPDL